MAEFTTQDRYHFVARVVVSVIILGAGIFVLLWGNYPDATLKWAIGSVGVVIGYWLR